MVAIAGAVVKQERRISVVCHNHIHKSVIVEICESNSTTYIGSCKAISRQLAYLNKLAVSVIMEQRIDLLVMSPRCSLFHLGIDVAVGDKKIQPAIVVIIEKAAAETEHIACLPGDAGCVQC